MQTYGAFADNDLQVMDVPSQCEFTGEYSWWYQMRFKVQRGKEACLLYATQTRFSNQKYESSNFTGHSFLTDA